MKRSILSTALIALMATGPMSAAEDWPGARITAEDPELLRKYYTWSQDFENALQDVTKLAKGMGEDLENDAPASFWPWIEDVFKKGEFKESTEGPAVEYPAWSHPAAAETDDYVTAMVTAFVRIPLSRPRIQELDAEKERLEAELERIEAEDAENEESMRSLHNPDVVNVLSRVRETQNEYLATELEAAQAERRLEAIRERLETEEARLNERFTREFERRALQFEAESERLARELEGIERLHEQDMVTDSEVEKLRLRLETLRAYQEPNQRELLQNRLHGDPVYIKLREMLVEAEIDWAGLSAKLELLERRKAEVDSRNAQVKSGAETLEEYRQQSKELRQELREVEEELEKLVDGPDPEDFGFRIIIL